MEEYEGYQLKVEYDYDMEYWECSVEVPTPAFVEGVCAHINAGHATKELALAGGRNAVDQGWLEFTRCPVCKLPVGLPDQYCINHRP